MTAIINYILEANLGLLLTLAFYMLFLRKETNFRFMRIYLLAAILASLVFPLVDVQFNQESSPLSIGRLIPSYWLPEVVITASGEVHPQEASLSFWKYAGVAYYAGLILCCLLVILQLIQLWRIFKNSTTYQVDKLRIAESTEDKPTFSFFNFIFIGKAHELSAQEKEQIILHESVHARQWHSFDILLTNILKVFFWFNPFINTYKKNFIQLHEFEADARAVENADVNKYCSLLARVALESADYRLANHFNNSLTVKRIEMMRTIKTNIKEWKLIALALVLPVVFIFVACQDQVENEMMEITQNSSHALIVPEYIEKRFEQVKKANPQKKYALLELNETASQKLETLKQQYGLPASMEVLKIVNGKPVGEPVTGRAGNIIVERKPGDSGQPSPDIKIRRTEPQVEGEQTFAIVEFNDQASRITEAAAQDEKVFTVVEEQPEFNGGYDAMMAFIRENLRYPADARQQGVEGTVYVSFIVETDGRVTSPKIIRGISPACDDEVVRIMELMPKWKPGKQSGQDVRVRFVLPIKFSLNNQSAPQK